MDIDWEKRWEAAVPRLNERIADLESRLAEAEAARARMAAALRVMQWKRPHPRDDRRCIGCGISERTVNAGAGHWESCPVAKALTDAPDSRYLTEAQVETVVANLEFARRLLVQHGGGRRKIDAALALLRGE